MQMVDEPNFSPSASPSPGEPRSRRRWWIPALVLLLALYIASPYYAFWRFTVALRAGDAAQLERTVDFASVRKSMRHQLSVRIAELRPQNPKRQKIFDAVSSALGTTVIDSLLDAYLTPEGLAAFLANPKVAGTDAPPPPGAASAGPAIPRDHAASAEAVGRRIGWENVHYAFFTSPRNFLVDVGGTKLRFRFNGLRWRVKDLEVDLSKVKI
jgi:hypothetical protein